LRGYFYDLTDEQLLKKGKELLPHKEKNHLKKIIKDERGRIEKMKELRKEKKKKELIKKEQQKG
jgi:hypothetical protein